MSQFETHKIVLYYTQRKFAAPLAKGAIIYCEKPQNTRKMIFLIYPKNKQSIPSESVESGRGECASTY